VHTVQFGLHQLHCFDCCVLHVGRSARRLLTVVLYSVMNFLQLVLLQMICSKYWLFVTFLLLLV